MSLLLRCCYIYFLKLARAVALVVHPELNYEDTRRILRKMNFRNII